MGQSSNPSRANPAGNQHGTGKQNEKTAAEAEREKLLLARYNCGPVRLSGEPNALYERHLTFDQVVPDTAATARDKYEAIARSVRDVLSQRWLKTEETYRRRNAKRVYYLSMEFLL